MNVLLDLLIQCEKRDSVLQLFDHTYAKKAEL